MMTKEKDDREEEGQKKDEGEAEGEGSEVEEAVCVEKLKKKKGILQFSLLYTVQISNQVSCVQICQ